MTKLEIPNIDKAPKPKKTDGRYPRCWVRLHCRKHGIPQFHTSTESFNVRLDEFDRKNPHNAIALSVHAIRQELLEGRESNNYPAYAYTQGTRSNVKNKTQEPEAKPEDSGDDSEGEADEPLGTKGQSGGKENPVPTQKQGPEPSQTGNGQENPQGNNGSVKGTMQLPLHGLGKTESFGHIPTPKQDEHFDPHLMDYRDQIAHRDRMVELEKVRCAEEGRAYKPPRNGPRFNWRENINNAGI